MTDIDDQETSPSGWSRRTVLKGAAAGTVLWAVPSVTSLATRASAASNSAVCSPTGDTATCNPGDKFNTCGDLGEDGCFCYQDVNGNEVCVQDTFCDDPNQVVCTASSQCPAGQTCLAAADCGPQLCVPCCSGTAPNAQRRANRVSGRRTNSGRTT